jgi:hypothetical protein
MHDRLAASLPAQATDVIARAVRPGQRGGGASRHQRPQRHPRPGQLRRPRRRPAPPARPRAYSERAQWLVDREVAALLTRAEAPRRNLLTGHIDALNQLTTALLEHQTMTGDQVRALVAASPARLTARTRPPSHHRQPRG